MNWRLSRILLVASCTATAILGWGLQNSNVQAAVPQTNFPSVVTEAMTYIQPRTKIALVAPTYIAQQQTGQYLTALVTANATSYNVNIRSLNKPLPINSPDISDPQYNGLAQWVGGFSAKKYATASASHAAFNQSFSYASHLSGIPHSIYLGSGVTGKLYSGQYTGTITWQMGTWQFQVNNGTTSANVSIAETIINQVQHTPLPHEQGEMVVQNAGDGEHTQIAFLTGTTLMIAANYHSATDALQMTSSMKPYQSTATTATPPAMLAAINHLTGETAIPLLAPLNLGITALQASTMTEQDTASYGHYQVNLSLKGASSTFASFSGQGYVQKPTALALVKQLATSPTYAGAVTKTVSLGSGIEGTVYSQLGLVRWKEGQWTFDVEAGSLHADVKLSTQIVTYLATHLLPETTGYMWVKNTPVAQFSHVYWATKDTLYSIYSTTSTSVALKMATSMASF